MPFPELTGLPTPQLVGRIGSTSLYGSGADIDIMAYWEEPVAPEEHGWTLSAGAYRSTGEFTSWVKHGGLNLLVMHTKANFHLKMAGFVACQYLADNGLLPQANKELRVTVHNAIRKVYV